MHLLRIRFPDAVPTDLVAAIQTVTDLDQLEQWFDAAAKAESLDAFRAAVER